MTKVTAGGNEPGAEHELGNSVNNAASMIPDDVPVLVWATSPSGNGEFFNAGWLSLTGRALDDQLGTGWLCSVHPDDRQMILAGCQDPGTSQQPQPTEFRVLAGDGEYRWVLARSVGRFSAEGTMTGALSAALDVTDRHRIESERIELLVGAHEANAQLATLQELTARLAGLSRPEEVAEVVLGQGVAELGGSTGSLCLLRRDGRDLEVAAQVGYPDDVKEVWGRFPLDAPTPAGDAVRRREAIFVSSLVELCARYPIFGDTPIVGDEALACIPLITDCGQALGAMVIGFAETRTFPPADRRLLMSLAAQAAMALARTRSQIDLEAAREQLAYLADASTQLAATLDVTGTLATIAALSVPRLADRCSLYLLGNGKIETMLLVPAEPGRDIQAFLERYPVDLNERWGVGAVLRTGRPEFLPVVDEAMLAEGAGSDDRHELLRRIGFGAVLILPLRARRRTLGVMALTNAAGRTMSEQQRALAEELGARAAVALDNAQLFAKQTDLADRLQASLLPPALPTIAGVDLAARYAAAGEGAEVGGDFYDCIACGHNRWLMVVGDVKGKGVDAAALTGMARHTIRAAAHTLQGPAAVLALLNQVLISHEGERRARQGDDWVLNEPRFCTVAAVLISEEQGHLEATVTSAGHPLPLLRHPDGRVTRVGAPGTLLGISHDIDLHEVTVTLERGSALVCFTDGVSECHSAGRFFDEEGVAAVVASAGHGSAEAMAEAIEAEARTYAADGIIRDDMAILIVRVPA